MRTRASLIRRRFAIAASRLGRDAVTFTWTDVAGGTVDPVTKALVGGVTTERSKTVHALVHWPQVGGSTGVRQFSEFDDGDVIVDLTDSDHDELAGKANVSFLIQGVRYRQKEVSQRLATSWDVVVAGVRLARPLLLEVAR